MHIWVCNVLLVQIVKGNSARKDANANEVANKSYSSFSFTEIHVFM